MEYRKCECSDKGCPVDHAYECIRRATTTLYRIDQTDYSGTLMCEPCAADALSSGLFTDEADEDPCAPDDEETAPDGADAE
jgi:hypothetical protein